MVSFEMFKSDFHETLYNCGLLHNELHSLFPELHSYTCIECRFDLKDFAKTSVYDPLVALVRVLKAMKLVKLWLGVALSRLGRDSSGALLKLLDAASQDDFSAALKSEYRKSDEQEANFLSSMATVVPVLKSFKDVYLDLMMKLSCLRVFVQMPRTGNFRKQPNFDLWYYQEPDGMALPSRQKEKG